MTQDAEHHRPLRTVSVPENIAPLFQKAEAYVRRYFADRDLVIVDSRTNRIVAVIRAVLP